jgi:hypothetical protein
MLYNPFALPFPAFLKNWLMIPAPSTITFPTSSMPLLLTASLLTSPNLLQALSLSFHWLKTPSAAIPQMMLTHSLSTQSLASPASTQPFSQAASVVVLLIII